MKIGILTHHYVKNFGAFLQAEALVKTLSGIYPDADIKIVHYIKRYHLFRNIIHVVRFRRKKDTMSTYGQRLKLLRTFIRFEHSLPVTHRVYRGSDIDTLNLDCLIIGSDEGWDFEDYGFSPIKFGVGICRTPVIAYAPSIGRADPMASLGPEIQKSLSAFCALSARDEGTVRFIRQQTGRDAAIMIDPVFLYNWEDETDEPYILEPYVLVYDCKMTCAQKDNLKRFAESHQLLIIGAGEQDRMYDRMTTNLTPYQWVNLFRYARKVVTGTFHGVLFSVIFRRSFVTCPTEKNRIRKITSFLSDVGLEAAYYHGECNNFAEMLENEIDYSMASLKILRMQSESLVYLKESISKRRVLWPESV